MDFITKVKAKPESEGINVVNGAMVEITAL